MFFRGNILPHFSHSTLFSLFHKGHVPIYPSQTAPQNIFTNSALKFMLWSGISFTALREIKCLLQIAESSPPQSALCSHVGFAIFFLEKLRAFSIIAEDHGRTTCVFGKQRTKFDLFTPSTCVIKTFEIYKQCSLIIKVTDDVKLRSASLD